MAEGRDVNITKAVLQGRIEQLEGRIYQWENLLTEEEKRINEPFGQWDYESDVEELEELRKELRRA